MPILNVVPSNVKLASSSSSPLTPAITIRLSVKSSTFALANELCPSTSNVPISCVSDVTTSTVIAGINGPTLNLVPSNVKLESSSNSPFVPTITILSFVKSVTFKLGSVVCPVALVEPVATSTVNAPCPISKVTPSNVKLASSSNSPNGPEITTLLSVKSSTFALAKVAWSSVCILPLL